MPERQEIIAGHKFDLNGNCTFLTQNGAVCPIRWSWVRHCTDDKCVGIEGVAHHSVLTSEEIRQIREEVNRLGEYYMDAIRGIGAGVYSPKVVENIELGDAAGAA